MATRTEELEKLERTIKDADIRLSTLQVQVDTLNKELATITWTESVLQDNLNCLKQEKIIALAAEYKKAKDDIAKIKAKKIIVTNDKLKIDRSYKETAIAKKRTIVALEALKEKLENNVLVGNFRKQEDGQS